MIRYSMTAAKRTLLCFLTALMTLQSIYAVADMHQLHQSGSEHIAVSQDHPEHTEKTFQNPDVNAYDCHHCCHCHGIAHFFVASQQHQQKPASPGNARWEYQVFYLSRSDSPDNPPPIL